MLGAMEAVQPTFKDSLRSCVSQVVGVLLGALVGVALMSLPINHVLAAGLGIVAVITVYNGLRLHFSPSLACLIVVTLCYDTSAHPILYACGRIWDTAIGLSVGMLINTMIFPYDNSKRIRELIHSLDQEVIGYLEDMFDGDDILPDSDTMTRMIDDMDRQLAIFSKQRLFHRLRKQRQELQTFRDCEWKARQLVAHMEVLCHMDRPGRLNTENRAQLESCNALIQDERLFHEDDPRDTVTNYHVAKILTLRQDLLHALEK
jgi:uncharacterized membrane protein YgaE (UPF0421/DUF939 family)